MHYLSKIIIVTLIVLSSSSVFSQSIDGLKDIVSFQQEKIITLEENFKKLVGSIERQSNSNIEKSNKEIQSQINKLNEKLKYLENSIKNITDLSFNLDFALKRIERHLELRSIQNNNVNSSDNVSDSKLVYQKQKNANVNMKSLDGKTDGVLGFINESNKENSNKTQKKIKIKPNLNANKTLPHDNPQENFNFALDLARQLDFENAEKAFKEFLVIHKGSKQQADAQYWLGKIYFTQEKFPEAAIAMAEFNTVFPNDERNQDASIIIAEASANFADQKDVCLILNNSLQFVTNPSNKFIKKIKALKIEKKCPDE